MENRNHAIVFGATGLLGWAVVNQLLSGYPSADSFSTVTAVINRQVTKDELLWPNGSDKSTQLDIISGINIAEGTGETLAQILSQKVANVKHITHVFYFGTVVESETV